MYSVFHHDGLEWKRVFTGTEEQCEKFREEAIEKKLNEWENEDEYFDPERDRKLLEIKYVVEQDEEG